MFYQLYNVILVVYPNQLYNVILVYVLSTLQCLIGCNVHINFIYHYLIVVVMLIYARSMSCIYLCHLKVDLTSSGTLIFSLNANIT